MTTQAMGMLMLASGDSSVELARALLDGDDSSATPLFTRYRGRSLKLAERRMSARLLRRLDPEDIYQSVCVTLLRGLRCGQFHLTGQGDLWKLLRTLIDHRLRKRAEYHLAERRSMAREVCGQALSQHVDASSVSELSTLADRDEVSRFLSQCLNPRHRQVVELLLQGHGVPEIAVESRYSEVRVRQILRSVEAIATKMEGQ